MKGCDAGNGPTGGRNRSAYGHHPLPNKQDGKQRRAGEAEQVNCEFELTARFHVGSENDRDHDMTWPQLTMQTAREQATMDVQKHVPPRRDSRHCRATASGA